MEGPIWADTVFYGRWFLAVSKANAIWERALADREFRKKISRLLDIQYPSPNIAATVWFSLLEKRMNSFVDSMGDEGKKIEFSLMAMMGLFLRVGQRYQMNIPKRPVPISKVKTAAVRMAATLDENHELHLEEFVYTMTYNEAVRSQNQLTYRIQ